MRETYEFRVDKEYAHQLFEPRELEAIGSELVYRVHMDREDPRLAQVGEIDRTVRSQTDVAFFYGWRIHREYTQAELESASLFRLEVRSFFEPEGERSGTRYDESVACPDCGAGAEQVGPLLLQGSRIPKGKDISQTIANEIVVSRRVVDLLDLGALTGADLAPVRVNRGREVSEKWFQLQVPEASAEIVPPTRVGINPFDEDPDGEYRCPRRDLIGLNLLSEVSIRSSSRGNTDFLTTKQFLGRREGVLRPFRVILVSPRVRQMLVEEGICAVEMEVAHLA